MRVEKIMAGPLLGVAVAAVLVQGCLLPQDDQVIDNLPPKRNSYPRIVPTLTEPGNETTVDLGTGCTRTAFTVSVEDPDLTDKIRNKWFVDPDDSFTTVSFSTKQLEGSKSAIRNTALIAPTQLFSAGSPLWDEPGIEHQLTVVIADGEFEGTGILTTGTDYVVPAEDGGTRILTDPSYTAQHTWRVITNRNPCQ